MIGLSFNEMRNKVFMELLQDVEVIKALVIEDEDFLNVTPNEKQQKYIDNPQLLIREYIYPYKRMFDTITEKHALITTEFSEFYKIKNNYRNGLLTFYILCPVDMESTTYGIRYDFIGDKLEEIFNNTQIGEFNFYNRGDIDIGDRYIGHYVTFQIAEFYII